MQVQVIQTDAEKARAYRGMILMGTKGRELDQARAGVAGAFRHYRKAQDSTRRGWGQINGSPEGWRPHVRQAIAKVRSVEARIDAEAEAFAARMARNSIKRAA